MKKILTILFVAMLSMAAATSAQAQETEHKLVIQMVNGDSLSQFGLMKNLKNLNAGWPELQIEVVCHGPGITLLHKKKSPYLEDVAKYAEMGVTFAACENTLKGKNIPKEMITESAVFVPMGIKEIVLKQEEGWTYIKTGIVKE